MNKKIINKIILKLLISLLLFLLFMIFNKNNSFFKSIFYEKIYNSNISFAKINHLYETYFGNIFPIKNVDEIQVFNENISYYSKKAYLDAVKLIVKENYVVPSLTSGIVVFIGEKEGYGKTIIVEDETGLDVWYSNINISNILIYDYINKGDYLGESISDFIIMKFQREGEIEDYNQYI